MYRFRALRRLFSWIALAAVLGGALTPALAQALSDGNTAWLEICTAKGVTRVTSDVTSSNDEIPIAGHGMQMEHCPFCVPYAGSLSLLSSAVLVFRLPEDRSSFLPALYFSAPQRLFVWTSAHSRAPPVFSA